MKKLSLAFAAIVAVIAPALAQAQYLPGGPGAVQVVNKGVAILQWIPKILFTLMFIYLVYNIFTYVVRGKNNAEEKAEALKGIFFGILGLFIALAIPGITLLIARTTGVGVGSTIGGAQGQYLPQSYSDPLLLPQ